MKVENFLEQIGVNKTPRNKDHGRKLIEICKMLGSIRKDIVRVERNPLGEFNFGTYTEIQRYGRAKRIEGDKVTAERFTIYTKSGTYNQVIPTNNDLHREICALIGEPVINSEAARLVVDFDKEQTKFIKKALAFCSTDGLKPAQNCVRLKITEGICEVVATDGNRLLKHELKSPQFNIEETLLIPAKNLTGFKGSLQLFNEYYQIDSIRYQYQTSEVNAQFPKYESVWPEYKGEIEVFKSDLVNALKPMKQIVNKWTKQTKFYFNGAIMISAEETDFGRETESKVNYLSKTAPDFKIAFNLEFLMEGLDLIESNTIRIATDGNKKKPILLNNMVLICPCYLPEEEETTPQQAEPQPEIEKVKEIQRPISAQYIDNCSHGYLAVSLTDFKRVMNADTAKKITGYSGLNSSTVYLEEDCDAGTFMNEAKAKGIEIDVVNVYNERFVCAKNYSARKLKFAAEFVPNEN